MDEDPFLGSCMQPWPFAVLDTLTVHGPLHTYRTIVIHLFIKYLLSITRGQALY